MNEADRRIEWQRTLQGMTLQVAVRRGLRDLIPDEGYL